MGYDLSTPERYIERLSVSIPFGLHNEGWKDILELARQKADTDFHPTRFWVVVDEQDADKKALALQEKPDSELIVLIDLETPTLTETQVRLLDHFYCMATPPYSID